MLCLANKNKTPSVSYFSMITTCHICLVSFQPNYSLGFMTYTRRKLSCPDRCKNQKQFIDVFCEACDSRKFLRRIEKIYSYPLEPNTTYSLSRNVIWYHPHVEENEKSILFRLLDGRQWKWDFDWMTRCFGMTHNGKWTVECTNQRCSWSIMNVLCILKNLALSLVWVM